jgi:DNA-directed RNA polymerase specialized sigma24 family protein
MNETHSITRLIEQLKDGNSIAAHKIWDRYVENLIRVANRRLQTSHVRLGDEEDAVVVAFAQFLERVNGDGFSNLNDREDLWRILVMLTERRACDMIRREKSIKSGGNLLVGESRLEATGGNDQPHGLDQVEGAEPTPEFTALVIEEFQRRIKSLNNDELISIAIAKMNGFNNREVAEQRGISVRSIERKLAIIRAIWQDRAVDAPDEHSPQT